MTRRASLGFTITRDDGETEIDVEAVPTDPPDPSVGIQGWGFECVGLDEDGAEVALTEREHDRASDKAAEIMRRGLG